MPSYAKFLKDVIAKKRKWGEFETVNLTESCSAIIQKKLPAKKKDPGSFTISCVVGEHQVGNALCDLGASINLMPLSFFKKLKIGNLKPTTITLQMADRSVSYPEGIVEDILVKVDKFIFPVDFVVLDMEEDKKVPLILGRPFLCTGKALIDVDQGALTLRLNNESVTFSIYDAMKKHNEEEDGGVEHCKVVKITDECIKDVGITQAPTDQLEKCLSKPFYNSQYNSWNEIDTDLFEFAGALDSLKEMPRPRFHQFLPLRNEAEDKERKEKKLELMPLPDHLQYAYLGDQETFPVIVSSFLSHSQLDKLSRVLRKHKKGIGWSISDLKGMRNPPSLHLLK